MPSRSRSSPPAASWESRVAEGLVWLVLFAVAVVVIPTAQEAFRLPKLLVAETLALASVGILAIRLRHRERVQLEEIWQPPVVRAVLPFVLVATLGLAFTDHAAVVREGLADLWIGAAALVAWSLGLARERLRRLMAGLLLPAALLAVVAILQIHELARPLGFFGLERTPRMQWTSLAGNPGDLAGFLALAAVVAQAEIRRRRGAGRGVVFALLAVVLYALIATRTLAGIAAVLAGSVIFWALTGSGSRRRVLAVGVLAVGILVVALVGPVRSRLVGALEALRAGEVNRLLTGRLDGWRAALWMTAEHPATGVGHGAYGSVYGEAKLALATDGVEFSRAAQTAVFANAHNEVLEVMAETGLAGLLALAFGLWMLIRCLRRIDAETGEAGDRGLAWGVVGVLAVLSLAHFPFRVALIGYPALLCLAWTFRAGRPPAEAAS